MKSRVLVVAAMLVAAAFAQAQERRLEFPGGWYADARPNGAYAVLFGDSHVQTDRGRVENPVAPSNNVLYLRLNKDGSKFAGQGHHDGVAWEYAHGSGYRNAGVAFGVNPTIYDASDNLALAVHAQTGSQGWRYLSDDGTLVSGDSTYADPARGLWEYTVRRTSLGEFRCGQGGDEEGLQCLINGRRVMVERGDARFVRFNTEGDNIVLAFSSFAGRKAVIIWTTAAALNALPTFTPPVEPTPVEVCGNKVDDDKDGLVDEGCPAEPQTPSIPLEVCETIKRVRGSGPITSKGQIGDMLNRIAWEHRALGFGLSRKSGGNRCPSKVGDIACDILQLPPAQGNWLFDVFGSADVGEPTSPSCGESIGPSTDASRPWVAPVNPGGVVPVDPVDPGESDEVKRLRAKVAELEASLAALDASNKASIRRIQELEAERDALKARIDGQDAGLQDKDAEIARLNELLARPVGCVAKVPAIAKRLGIKVGCEVVR